MKIKYEFKIGFWAIVTLSILFYGINWLKGLPMFKQGQNYCLCCDKVDGLAVSSHVMLHGMKVGTVLQLEYDNQKDLINVIFSLYDKELRMPKDTRLTVVSELLGTSNIIIEMGDSAECYEPGDTIMAPPAVASLLEKADPIVAQVEQLMPKIDTLVGGINVLVNESQLHESMLEIHQLTTRLNQTVTLLNRTLSKDVPAVMANVKTMTANLDTVSAQLKDAEVQQLVASASQTISEANQILAMMQSQQSSVGKLLNTTELHDQLTATMSSLDSLLTDIRQNPKRYINVKVF